MEVVFNVTIAYKKYISSFIDRPVRQLACCQRPSPEGDVGPVGRRQTQRWPGQ